MVVRIPALVPILTTLAGGIAGGAGFAALHLPVPWLAGPMVAVAALAMMAVPVAMPPTLRDLGFLFAGASLGATITPEALAMIARYPVSLIGLAVSAVVTVTISSLLLRRYYGWDAPTAYLASVPGALSMVMAVAVNSGGDIRKIAVVQAVRVFALVAILPLALNLAAAAPVKPPVALISAGGLAMLFLAIFAATYLIGLLKFANPMFLGAMITSTVVHVTDLIPGDLPDVLTFTGMFIIGMFCGVRFEGTTPRELVTILKPAVTVLSIALVISGLFATGVHLVTQLPLAAVLVAFAPGGVEAMILMGAAMGLDTLYISTHHVLRAFGLNAVAPVFAPRPEGGSNAPA